MIYASMTLILGVVPVVRGRRHRALPRCERNTINSAHIRTAWMCNMRRRNIIKMSFRLQTTNFLHAIQVSSSFDTKSWTKSCENVVIHFATRHSHTPGARARARMPWCESIWPEAVNNNANSKLIILMCSFDTSRNVRNEHSTDMEWLERVEFRRKGTPSQIHVHYVYVCEHNQANAVNQRKRNDEYFSRKHT